MQDLWGVLGYDAIASRIAASLRESSDITVLEGPPGVGKSWLAKGIGELWEASGGCVAVADGDPLRSDVALYPFRFALAGLSQGWKALGPALGEVAKAAEILVGTAGIITATVQTLVTAHRTQRRGRMMLLTDAEQEIFVELEGLAKQPPLLLIADNLHWWDSRSLEFLGRLRNARMREAFPFLGEMRVLAVQTPAPYQTVANPKPHEALLAPIETEPVPLPRIPPENFNEVLVSLGAPDDLSVQVAEEVHMLSGGNLAIARQITMRMEDGNASLLESSPSEIDFGRFVSERIRSLGEEGKEAVALLEVAARVGQKFRHDELVCAAGVSDAATARLLRYCRNEEVVRLEDKTGRFAHPVFHKHFLALEGSDIVGIHERLSDCFRRMRPSEYDLRCVNAIDAERTGEAAVLAVQAALQAEREGRSWRKLPERILAAITIGGLGAEAERLVLAMEHLKWYRTDDCIAILDELRSDLPYPLLAESAYIRAQCHMSTRSEEDREKGRQLLRRWSNYVDEEPEVGTRLTLLLLYGLMHLADKQPGIEFEAEVAMALTKRLEFDDAAGDALHVLDRCSGGLHPVDDSLRRVKRAVEYFGPGEGRTLVRRPVEYYRALVNLGSSQVSNGKYEKACETHETLTELVDQFPEGVFSRLDYAIANAILAEFRAGRIEADGALERQRQLLDWPAVRNDPFYCENALGVYLALAGRDDEALPVLDDLERHLFQTRPNPEPNMTYLIGWNKSMVRFVSGERARALEELSDLEGLIPRIVFPSRPVYERRHRLLAEVLRNTSGLSATQLDQVLLDCHREEFGPQWKDYAHGFILPAVEMWREN